MKRVGLKLTILLSGLFLGLAIPGYAQAGLVNLPPIVTQTTSTVTSTLGSVASTVDSLGLPVQVGTSSSGLPTVQPIDPNALLGQTINTVNSLPLPVQLPQVDLGLPTTPAIDPGQLVGNTVDGINNTVPLPVEVPNPITLLTNGGGLPGLPGLPDLPGLPSNDPSTFPTTPAGRSVTLGPNNIVTPIGLLTGGGTPAELLGARYASGVLAVLRSPGSSNIGGLAGVSNLKLAPADASENTGNLTPVTSGLALLPLLGVVCVFLALAGYFRSARSIWAGRPS